MANDIIDIDVFQTVENVEITVEPNLTTVNITDSVAVTDITKLAILNNLSDLNNVSTARTNLGLGTLATQSGTFSDKANLSGAIFTGSVVVPNATLSTQAVNKGQLDGVNAKVSQYKTYFINTSTGNNATGVFEDASKPFASIDYVNANFTIQDNDIFYLQGTGLTYAINNQLQAKKQTFRADSGSTNILDFSSNANTNAMITGSNNIVTIDMLNGVFRCERSGGTGVLFSVVNIKVKDIYWNTSTTCSTTATLEANKVSSRFVLFGTIVNSVILNEFVCLGSSAKLAQFCPTIRINLISGSGSYTFCYGNDFNFIKYTIGNVTATGGLVWSGYFGEMDVTFDNSTITSFNLFANSGLKTLRGTIKSITSISGSINSTKFINFTANLGTGNMTLGASNATVTFENSSIKSTNSPIIITAGAFSNVLEIKNSAFEVVNAVPLITGGAGGTNTVKIAGVSTNATVLSDQSGTGVTVNVIGKQSVATAVSPNDAVTKAQLDAAVISGGGGGSTNLSTTYAPTTVTVVSSSGTDAEIKAVDGVDAGIVTVAQKSTWDGKQDALGFTPYNATNPSGYQTAGQVTTAITNRIKDDVYEGGAWVGDQLSTATRDALYNKFELTSSEIAGKQPLSAVLTATTASFTTADETKLDGIATGATANSSDATLLDRANHTGTQLSSTISDFNSAARAQTEAELLAGANITITPSGTGATRQLTIASTGGSSATSGSGTVPSGNITWGTTAPTTVLSNTYEWEEDNNVVTLRINLSYSTSATNQSVTIALPSDAPTPKDITGFTSALDVVAFGSGMIYNVISSLPSSAGRYCLLRRNTANTGYEIVVTHGSAVSVRTVALTIQYFK